MKERIHKNSLLRDLDLDKEAVALINRLWCSTVRDFLGASLLARVESGEWTQEQCLKMMALQETLRKAVSLHKAAGSLGISDSPLRAMASNTPFGAPNPSPQTVRDGGRQMTTLAVERVEDVLKAGYFSIRAWHCIQRLGVKTWGQFSNLTSYDVLGTRNAGAKTWQEISKLQCRMELDDARKAWQVPTVPPCREQTSSTWDSGGEGPEKLQRNVPVPVDRDESLRSSDFSVRTWRCLERLGVETRRQLNQLTSLEVMSIYSEAHAGRKTWSEISSFQKRVSGLILEETPLDYSSFDSLAKSYCHAVLNDPRDERAVWARWNVEGATKAPTLDMLGRELGLTRERIRQIVKNGEHKLKSSSPLLSRLWQAILEFTGPQCVISSLPDLSAHLCERFDWSDSPGIHQLGALVELHSGFRVADSPNGRKIQIKNQKTLLLSIVQVIIQLARDNATQRDAADLWSIDFETLRQLLGRQYRALLKDTGLPSFPEYLVDLALSEASHSVRREGSSVYSTNLWSLRFGSQLDLVETILLRQACSMHFRDVHKEALVWRPSKGLSAHNIHACLDRSTKALLWGRGSFIHRDHISVPYEIIRRAESWLLNHLAQDASLYCAHGLHERFTQELSGAGISSEIALYSCLRISSHPELSYPRYPYILLIGNTRLPVTLLLEEYVQQAGRPVSLQELRSFACETMGVDDVQFQIQLQDIPNVIRNDHASYLHSDWLSIDISVFGDLCKYLHGLLRRHQHVSILHVFEDRQVTCRRLGIISPEMLYSLLDVYSSNEFDLSHYPQVTFTKVHDNSGTVAGITQAVLDFLKEQARPCSYAELEDHFVSQRRYRLQTIYGIAQNENVLNYADGCVAHREVLGLSPQMQRRVEDLACSAFAQKESQGGLYVLADDIIEFFELPALANGISWTPTLVADVLSKSKGFRVLGSARKAILPVPNKRGILTLEDLIRVLVQEEYSGTVQVPIIEEQLRIRQIIKKRLTEKMLGNGSKVRIVDGEVVVLEPAGC